MTTTAKTQRPTDTQHARAAHMRDLFEPWSYRRLEARTGIGRTSLQGKFSGNTPFTLGDIEILAPVIRMTPEELAIELFGITEKAPTPKGEGQTLPELDSNQQPADLQLAPVIRLGATKNTVTQDRNKLAIVTPLRKAI